MLEDPTARKAYTSMKAGVVKGLSIGYETIESKFEGDIRHLTQIRLWEVSAVLFPMNELALVSGVKALSPDDVADHLRAIDTHRKAIDRHQRGIQAHLKSMLDFDDDDEDDLVDDPEFEGEDGDDDGKALLAELKQLAEQAEALTSK